MEPISFSHGTHSIDQKLVLQMAYLAVNEVIKIVAAGIFLGFLEKQFLRPSAPFLDEEPYLSAVKGPIQEEFFFRLYVLEGIHFIQFVFNDFNRKSEEELVFDPPFQLQLHSGIWPTLSTQGLDEKKFTVPLHLPFVEELCYHGLQKTFNYWLENRNIIRIQLVSHLFPEPFPEDSEEELIIIPVSLPVCEEVLIDVYMYTVDKCNRAAMWIFDHTHLNGIFNEPTNFMHSFHIPITLPVELEILYRFLFYPCLMRGLDFETQELDQEEERAHRQQVFRIHLAALIFAASHFRNTHENKTFAVLQFVATYIGGLIYGYMTEKYYSLAPSILAHGLNNFLLTAIEVEVLTKNSINNADLIYSAFLINRISSFLFTFPSEKSIVSDEE